MTGITQFSGVEEKDGRYRGKVVRQNSNKDGDPECISYCPDWRDTPEAALNDARTLLFFLDEQQNRAMVVTVAHGEYVIQYKVLRVDAYWATEYRVTKEDQTVIQWRFQTIPGISDAGAAARAAVTLAAQDLEDGMVDFPDNL